MRPKQYLLSRAVDQSSWNDEHDCASSKCPREAHQLSSSTEIFACPTSIGKLASQEMSQWSAGKECLRASPFWSSWSAIRTQSLPIWLVEASPLVVLTSVNFYSCNLSVPYIFMWQVKKAQIIATKGSKAMPIREPWRGRKEIPGPMWHSLCQLHTQPFCSQWATSKATKQKGQLEYTPFPTWFKEVENV